MRIEKVVTRNSRGEPSAVFRTGDRVTVEVSYTAHAPIPAPYLWIGFMSQFGATFGANMLLDGCRPDRLAGRGQINCVIEQLPLLPHQQYVIRLGMREQDGRTPLIASCDVAAIDVTGAARDIGLMGEPAESVLSGSAPVVIPYTWEFADGRVAMVNILATPAGRNPGQERDDGQAMRG